MLNANYILSLFPIEERSVPSIPPSRFAEILEKRIRESLAGKLKSGDGTDLFSNIEIPVYTPGKFTIHLGFSICFRENFLIINNQSTLHIMNQIYNEIIKEKFNNQEFAKKYGWYIAGISYEDEGNFIIFEPIKSELKTDLPPYIYHITLKSNISSILKKGLIPSYGDNNLYGRDYRPNRVYIITDKSRLASIRDDLLDDLDDRKKSDYAIIVIDTSKLRPGTKFYRDPEFSDEYVIAYYTSTHIPPEACSVRRSFANLGK